MSKDGGPAFPMQFLGINRGALSYEDTNNQEGMSLRDYFAGQAMQSLARRATDFEVMAAYCYDMADAMLQERGKS